MRNKKTSGKLISQIVFTVCLTHAFFTQSVHSDELEMPGTVTERERIAQGKALFNAGEYRKAAVLFREALAIPEENAPFGCKTGVTPKPVRIRIWLARCQGRLGQNDAALKECLQITRGIKDGRGWWDRQDTECLAKTLVENARPPTQIAQVKTIARKQQFKELLEYFAAVALVEKKDAAGVVQYLTLSDVQVSPVDPPLWRDEIIAKAIAMKPEIIRYTIEQVEKTVQLGRSDLNMHHLHHLFEVLPDKRFVDPCLGSSGVERNFPDPYRNWLKIFRVYPQACKETALRALKGDRDSRIHALNLINSLHLYDRETLDAVAVVAAEKYYPTEVRSLLAMWRVSGKLFGLEANTCKLALKQAGDGQRRKSLSQAVEWWKLRREKLDAEMIVPVKTADREVLKRATRCTVEMIRLDAEKLLRKWEHSNPE